MTPETTILDMILQYANGGTVAVVAIVCWYVLKYIWPIWRKQRDDDILARQDENKLKRVEIRVLICFLDHLKKEGYEIDVPDLAKEI